MSESNMTCPYCGREPGGTHADDCPRSRVSQKLLRNAVIVVDATKCSFDEALVAVRKVYEQEQAEAAA